MTGWSGSGPRRTPARTRETTGAVTLVGLTVALACLLVPVLGGPAAGATSRSLGRTPTAVPAVATGCPIPAADILQVACDVGGAVLGAVGDAAGAVVGGAVDTVSSSVFSGLTTFVVDGAVWFLGQLADDARALEPPPSRGAHPLGSWKPPRRRVYSPEWATGTTSGAGRPTAVAR